MAAEFGVLGGHTERGTYGESTLKSTHCRDTGAPFSQRQAIRVEAGWPMRYSGASKYGSSSATSTISSRFRTMRKCGVSGCEE